MKLEHQIPLYRRLYNWTQTELARRVGVSTSTIYKLEINDVIPKITTVYKLAAALNIPVEEVFYPVGKKPKVRIPEELL
jgi:DNA-binding XRE family transcriptional regulator